VISLLGSQNFEYELIWDCWHKIKSELSCFSKCLLVSHLTIFPQHFWRPLRDTNCSGPFSHQPGVWLLQTRDRVGTEQGCMPPNTTLGSPLPWSSNPLSRLALTGLQREVDQLAWQFCPELISPWGKVSPQLKAHPTEQKRNLINSRESPRGIP
jgi:hypothetical protein